MDKRKNYYVVIDTETCNGLVVDEKLDLTQSLVYDIGWQVIDKQGKVYEKRSFAIFEIFCEMSDVMTSAYYANKIPNYWDDIKSGKRALVRLSTARNKLIEDLNKYNVKAVMAHNAGFDLRALNNTERYITKSKYRYFFPYKTEIWDTLKMANDVILTQHNYRKFCEENGYMTKHKTPRPRATAEILYRYISANYDFVEEHQGLADVEIESIIFAYCMRQHKKMRKSLF